MDKSKKTTEAAQAGQDLTAEERAAFRVLRRERRSKQTDEHLEIQIAELLAAEANS